MIISEASQLLADTVIALSRAQRERDAWRLVAVAGIHHASDLHRELDRVRDRYHRLLEQVRSSRREAA